MAFCTEDRVQSLPLHGTWLSEACSKESESDSCNRQVAPAGSSHGGRGLGPPVVIQSGKNAIQTEGEKRADGVVNRQTALRTAA